jgi:hypothetical protein
VTELYRFFGGAEGDPRSYNQVDWAQVFKRLLRDGYFPNVLNELKVIETNPARLAVAVDTGEGWLQGYWYANDALKEIDLEAADATNPRIDRIVLRLDTVTDRIISAIVLKGTPAVAPVAPALTRTEQIWELSLAQVYVGAGVTSIANANITDERNDSVLCGQAIPSSVEGHLKDLLNPHQITTEQIGAEPAITKKAAFNKDFGNTAGTVLQGNAQALDSAKLEGNTTAQVRSGTTKADVGLGNVGNYSSATTATGNTHALRDGSGDIHARLFRSEYDSTNANIGFLMTQVNTGTDNYIRPSTPAQVKMALGGDEVIDKEGTIGGDSSFINTDSTTYVNILNAFIGEADVRRKFGLDTVSFSLASYNSSLYTAWGKISYQIQGGSEIFFPEHSTNVTGNGEIFTETINKVTDYIVGTQAVIIRLYARIDTAGKYAKAGRIVLNGETYLGS